MYETLGAHYTDTMILEFIRDKNLLRQHLTEDQRAMLRVEHREMLAAATAAERTP